MHIDFGDFIKSEGIVFHCNPFGGVASDDLMLTLIPKYEIEEWISLIKQKPPKIIEFVGEKGRGKTTHLSVLHEYFTETPIYFLDRTHSYKKIKEAPIVFIDSIGRVPFVKRLMLWLKRDITYVVTTHTSRKYESKLCSRVCLSYNFGGIKESELKEIIIRRISLASNRSVDAIDLNSAVLKELISRYNDDFRGVLNFLYDNFNLKEHG